MRVWVRDLGSGLRTASARPVLASEPESDTARIRRLEAALAAERAEVKKLSVERDILRSAAKYFAGETRW